MTGLTARYRVEKINDRAGKHSECRFFVLDPQHDPIARVALRAYAEDPATPEGLRVDLQRWLDVTSPAPVHPVDPYCPDHGTEPTAYSRCSCRTADEQSEQDDYDYTTADIRPHRPDKVSRWWTRREADRG